MLSTHTTTMCVVCWLTLVSGARGAFTAPLSRQHGRPPWPPSHFRAVTVLHAPCNTLAYTLANVAGNLGKEWPIAVLYNDDLHAFVSSTKVVQTLTADDRLHSVPLTKAGFDTLPTASKRGYSRLLKSHAFWRYLAADHVLMFQTDSVLCSLSPWRVDDFLEYDFVGAPWMVPYSGIDVGNGGLSLRNVNTMLYITETCWGLESDESEDVYFARCFSMMRDRGERVHLPSPQVAASFAYETGLPPVVTSFGVHKLDAIRWDAVAEKHVTSFAADVAASCPEVVGGVLLSCRVAQYRAGVDDAEGATRVFLAAPHGLR